MLTNAQGNAKEQRKPDAQESTMSEYRNEALSALAAFEREDYATAREAARLLEFDWDANMRGFEVKSPEVYRNIDRAMDAFTKPIFQTKDGTSDPKTVLAAYEQYVNKLAANDEPWYGAPVAGDNTLDVVRTVSGLVYVPFRNGAGRQPKPGEIVVARLSKYVGNGGEMRPIQGSESPEAIRLQNGSKTPGLLEGLRRLRVGDCGLLIIPPALAYGTAGSSTLNILPNSPLVYFVDIADVKSDSLSYTVARTIAMKGVDAGISKYHELANEGFSDLYRSGQADLNALGYWRLQERDFEGAIKLFKLNVEAYPGSADVYDSLGEAYAKKGDKQQATEAYRKAVAIDPKMESSRKALKELGVE